MRNNRRKRELVINLFLREGPQCFKERLIFMLYILLSQWLRGKVEKETIHQNERKHFIRRWENSEFLISFPTSLRSRSY